MAKKEITWDLSEIFPGTTDPSIQKAIDDLTKMAEGFAGRYQGNIKYLSDHDLLHCIEEFEAYRAKLEEITLYAELSYAANMTLPDTQSLHERANSTKAKLNQRLAFFELELGNLVLQASISIFSPALKNHRHFLEKLQRRVPHQLTETEEKLVIQKDRFGVSAFEQLQGKWLGTRSFEVEVEGKKQTLSFEEAYGLFTHPNRATRESAYKSIHELLERDGEIYASALRNVCNDWLGMCERRNYDSPMQASLITNDVDELTISNLLAAVESHTDLCHRYMKLKAGILGLPRLGGHDLYAPFPDMSNAKFDYETAKTLAIQAYNGFDEQFASIAKELLARRHVDLSPRLGKQSGAFCASWFNGESQFILQKIGRAHV